MGIHPSVHARTVLATSSHVELGVLGQREVVPTHLVDTDGGILLRPGEGPCWERLNHGEACPQLDLVATDVSSVPQPDRIRARVRMRGRVALIPAPPSRQVLCRLGLQPGQSMCRFVPDSVVLQVSTPGRESLVAVSLPSYAEASPDPLAGWESLWVAHLDSDHRATLRALAQRQVPLTDEDSVRALQADSRGLTLRLYQADAHRDLRFDFAEPALCGCQAVAAFKGMIAG